MAITDAYAFSQIQDPALQQSAVSMMSDNASHYSDYKKSLERIVSVEDTPELFVNQQSVVSELPRMDVSGYGTWGAKVDESRDLADKHGLTEDITKMAVSGKTAIEIAQAM